MYTWGYIKENVLSKLNLSSQEANEQGFLSRFPYYANEAMTQICSAIKPNEKFLEVTIENENERITFPDDFVGFSDDVATYKAPSFSFGGILYHSEIEEAGDNRLEYDGYNAVVCKSIGAYRIPYKARWFFFTKELEDYVVLPIPADICDALPSYIASQCLKIDDEQKAAIFRNEYEMFLARIDDTNFKSQRTLRVGGDW